MKVIKNKFNNVCLAGWWRGREETVEHALTEKLQNNWMSKAHGEWFCHHCQPSCMSQRPHNHPSQVQLPLLLCFFFFLLHFPIQPHKSPFQVWVLLSQKGCHLAPKTQLFYVFGPHPSKSEMGSFGGVCMWMLYFIASLCVCFRGKKV